MSTAAYLVGFCVVIHLLFLYLLISRILNIQLTSIWQNYSYGIRKYIYIVILFGVFHLIYLLYYRKFYSQILDRYKQSKFSSLDSILKLILIMVLPLIGVLALLR